MLNESTQPALPHMEGPGPAPKCPCGAAVTKSSKSGQCQSCSRKRKGKKRAKAKGKVVSDGRVDDLFTPAATVSQCEGSAGLCIAFHCPNNLALDVSNAGTITIPGFAGRDGIRFQPKRNNKKMIKGFDVEEKEDQAADMCIDRSIWIVALAGSNCVKRIVQTHGELSQWQVGLLMNVEHQAIDQTETKALESLRGDKRYFRSARESFEQQSQRGEAIWPAPVEKLKRPQPAPQLVTIRRRPKEQP